MWFVSTKPPYGTSMPQSGRRSTAHSRPSHLARERGTSLARRQPHSCPAIATSRDDASRRTEHSKYKCAGTSGDKSSPRLSLTFLRAVTKVPTPSTRSVILRCEREARASKDERPELSPFEARPCGRAPQGDGAGSPHGAKRNAGSSWQVENPGFRFALSGYACCRFSYPSPARSFPSPRLRGQVPSV